MSHAHLHAQKLYSSKTAKEGHTCRNNVRCPSNEHSPSQQRQNSNWYSRGQISRVGSVGYVVNTTEQRIHWDVARRTWSKFDRTSCIHVRSHGQTQGRWYPTTNHTWRTFSTSATLMKYFTRSSTVEYLYTTAENVYQTMHTSFSIPKELRLRDNKAP